MDNQSINSEEEILAQSIKVAGQAYSLSEDRANKIISAVTENTHSPFASYITRRDQGRSIISNFTTHINVFMSTTAKVGLVVLVLGLVGVFGYSQLSTRSGDYAMMTESPGGADSLAMESANLSTKASSMATSEGRGSGSVDGAVSVILASAVGEELTVNEEDGDAGLIDADGQELQDLGQSFNDYEF
jgi:hypothetical protein